MKWEVGQTVMVQSRTWANINKPGGCAKIIKVHSTDDGSYIEGLDVKYVVDGRRETKLDPAIVSPYEHLERGGRKRRGRDFLMLREEDVQLEKRKSLERDSTPKKEEANSRNAPLAAAEAAEKENRSSRQSSATTCATPEKPKAIKKPKKVTPIPKMVITGRKIDDVSPLIEDVTLLAEKKRNVKKKAVARGLIFDPSDRDMDKDTDKDKEKPKATQQTTVPAASIQKKIRLPATLTLENTQSRTTTSALMDKKPAASILVPPRKKPPPTNNSTAKPSTKLKTKTAPSKCGNNSLATAAKPRNRYKSATASFSRVTSAYDKKRKASEKNRKPLLDVYRDEVQKARAFMDEMVRHGNDNELDDFGAARSERKGFFSTKSRYDEFLSHLYKVWIKIDEEEVSEERFREVYGQISSNSFTSEELDSHIQTMCDEGKEVMRSDGILYRIH